jgi:hypothetical protein
MKEVKETVEFVSSFVNGMRRSDVTGFVTLMSYEHRTLQQCFTGICLAWLTHLAGLKEGEYDGRNEASVKVAREIVAAVPNTKYGLPLI